jgi:hypothetical protein
VLFGAIAAVFAALAVRSARAGIVCDDVGLTGRTDTPIASHGEKWTASTSDHFAA